MSALPAGAESGWWSRRPRRPRWIYLLATAIVLGSVSGILTLVPVAHSATADYVVLLPMPSNASAPLCQGTVFLEVGTFQFTWLIPNGNPTTMTVQNSNGGPILYNQTTLGEGFGSVDVNGAATYYVFCLNALSNMPVGTGPFSVVEVVGELHYTYSAPIV